MYTPIANKLPPRQGYWRGKVKKKKGASLYLAVLPFARPRFSPLLLTHTAPLRRHRHALPHPCVTPLSPRHRLPPPAWPFMTPSSRSPRSYRRSPAVASLLYRGRLPPPPAPSRRPLVDGRRLQLRTIARPQCEPMSFRSLSAEGPERGGGGSWKARRHPPALAERSDFRPLHRGLNGQSRRN